MGPKVFLEDYQKLDALTLKKGPILIVHYE